MESGSYGSTIKNSFIIFQMEGTIVDVLVEVEGEEIVQVAKVVSETKKTCKVKFLSPRGDGMYTYDSKPTEIDKDCVDGYYYSKVEEDAGFIEVEDGVYQPADEYDGDYVPSSEEESDTDESLTDSEEEENVDE